MVRMHAIRLHESGPATNLVLDDLPDPTPAEGQVRIAVEAAGVHLLDTTLRSGDSGTPIPLPELPTIPGREVAGVGSAGRAAVLEPLGAALVVDYSRPGWAERVREQTDGLTVAYDGVGGDVGRQALELLRPGGRLVMFGWASGSQTRFDNKDVISRAITVGWSLGPRLFDLPGG